MKKTISLFLSGLLLCFVFVGCSRKKSEDAVVVYAEYNGALGTYDKEVKAAIEEKFFRDTGESISLQIEAVGTGEAGNKMGQAMASPSVQLDGFAFHYGGDSPLNGYILDDAAMDLTDSQSLAPEFFKYHNTAEYDPDGLSYYAGVYKDKLYSLSSQEYTSGWGVLVRRDHMANTDYSPDEYDLANPDCKTLSVSEFYDLLCQLQANNETVLRPLVGMSWEVDEVLGQCFNTVGYGKKVKDADGRIIPSYAEDGYLELMEFERRLQLEKLWIENPSATSVDLKQYFASGKGSVFVEWPEVTSQASIAANLKSEIGVDCIMLAPLKADGEETSKGNLRREYAFMGMMVPYKSENYELLLKYLNWLYSSVENYELAYYGIKGKHWIEGEDVVIDGRTYNTWAYPAGKEAEYTAAKPYSGIYCLLESVNMSRRLYAGYTQQQKLWIDKIRNSESYPERYAAEGVLLPAIPSSDRALLRADTAHGKEYVGVRKYAWSDAPIADGASLPELFAAMKNNLYGKYGILLDFYTNSYNEIIASRAKK